MKRLKDKQRRGLESLRTSVVALLLALVAGGVVIALSGFSPLQIYKAVFVDTLTTPQGVYLSLSQATPLMLTGVAFAIAFRVKLINLGGEGQLLFGAMASALVGAYIVGLPGFIHLPLALLAGFFAGGLIGLFTGYLKIRFGAREIITSIMLNEIIALFCAYLCNGPFKSENSIFPQTERIQDSAVLPKLVSRSQLTWAIIIAVVLAVFLQWMLQKTTIGYDMQTTGYNLLAARTAGVKVNRIYLFTIFLSGAICGLAGACMILGVNGRFIEGFSDNYGWGGISVAALAAYNPALVLVTSTIIGVLKAGAMTLNRTTTVPIEFVYVIQALVVVIVAAPKLINLLFSLPKMLFDKIRGLGRAKPQSSSEKGG